MEIIGILLVGFLVLIFILSYVVNKKTPLPEGHNIPSMSCAHCQSASCSYSQLNRPEGSVLPEDKEMITDCHKEKEEQ